MGLFPGGHAECSAADLAGNVWEWTRSVSRPYPCQPGQGTEDLDAPATEQRVLRGGSRLLSVRDRLRRAFRLRLDPGGRDHLRGAYRSHGGPDYRNGDNGFRCVVVAGAASGR